MRRYITTRSVEDMPHSNLQNPVGMVTAERYREPRLIGRHATPFAETVKTIWWRAPSQLKRSVSERALVKRATSSTMKTALSKRGVGARK